MSRRVRAAGQRVWRRTLRWLGPRGRLLVVLGVLLLVVVTGTLQLRRDADRLHAAALVQAATRPDSRTASLPPPPSSGEQVAAFVATMPPFEQSVGDLDRIFAAAADHKVALLHGEYRLKNDASTSLLSYTVTLPVKSSYGAVKAFTAEVMRSLPYASLDEFRLAREAADSATLDAVVRFTLVYRSK